MELTYSQRAALATFGLCERHRRMADAWDDYRLPGDWNIFAQTTGYDMSVRGMHERRAARTDRLMKTIGSQRKLIEDQCARGCTPRSIVKVNLPPVRETIRMKVLIACEYSGRVRDAFTARGHDAFSCDLLPTESPGPHLQGDVTSLLMLPWDLVIAFPPCTKLSCISVRSWPKWQADGTQEEAIRFFGLFTALDHVPRVAIENPAGIMSTRYRKPDQYVQPWWFGDPWTKRTGLWLKGLPKLVADQPVESRGSWVGTQRSKVQPDGTRRGPLSREGSIAAGRKRDGGIERSRARQSTFPGVARAMAEQWG